MKAQIKFDASTLEGATLDKLAKGELLINEKTGKSQESKMGGKKIAGFAAINHKGLYIRLNSKTKNHALVCVRAKTKDKVTGVVSGGERIAIGTLADFHKETTAKGLKKYHIEEIIKKLNDLYVNGSPDVVSRSNHFSLAFCFNKWLNKGNKKRAARTIEGVQRDLDIFAGDWRERSVTEIDDQEIIERAEQLCAGDFEKDCPRCEASGKIVVKGKEKACPKCDGSKIVHVGTYNTARRWLLSMSAIHNAARLSHKSFNTFEALLADSYPKDDGLQRAFTTQEIATVLNFEEGGCPTDRATGKPCAQKWLRMLALKFQLLSGLRIGDVVALREDEIKSDGNAYSVKRNGEEIEINLDRYIEHNASKAKNTGGEGRPHFLPIPAQLGAIIDAAIIARDSHPSMAGSEFLFPSGKGGRFQNPRDSFDVARDILSEKTKANPDGLIKPEKVPGNGERLIRSHDCRRTFRTVARDNAGVDSSTVDTLLDHGESAMDKIYLLSSHEQRMTALARLLPDHEMICDHFEKIARCNA